MNGALQTCSECDISGCEILILCPGELYNTQSNVNICFVDQQAMNRHNGKRQSIGLHARDRHGEQTIVVAQPSP